jgi:large subunit ribosomal protein L7/L12
MGRWCPEVVAIGDRLANLTLARSAELRRYLEEVHGLRPGAHLPDPDPVIVDPIPDLTPPRELFWDVRLDGFEPARKILAIKAVRELNHLGLKEARDLVEGPPRVLQGNLPQADAAQLRERLEASGLKVSLVPSPAEAG